MSRVDDIAEQTATLMQRLVEALIDNPRELNLDFRPMRARIDWVITPEINDCGKVIGKGGTHIKAIQFLFAKIGERAGLQFVVRLEEGGGVRRPDLRRPPASPTYSCVPAKQLLADLLALILEVPAVVTVLREGTTFTFRIEAQRVQDYERLVVADEPEGQTVIASLGTLFRAAGLRDGVQFRVEVPGR